MTNPQKPGTPAELVLAHHGVKGMQWGVRKRRPSAHEIRSARVRNHERQAQFIVNDAAIRNAPNPKSRAAAVKRQQAHVKEFNQTEDRVTAARTTRGEKAAALLLAGPVGAAVLVAGGSRRRAIARNVDKARKVN